MCLPEGWPSKTFTVVPNDKQRSDTLTLDEARLIAQKGVRGNGGLVWVESGDYYHNITRNGSPISSSSNNFRQHYLQYEQENAPMVYRCKPGHKCTMHISFYGYAGGINKMK